MKILIVEDSDNRIKIFKQKLIGHNVYIAKTAEQGINYLKGLDGQFDYCFLDHDLEDVFEQSHEGTGWGVAKWISEHPEKKPRYICIHSLNNVGASNMMNVLGDAGMRARYVPFAWLHLNIGPELGRSEEVEIKTETILRDNTF